MSSGESRRLLPLIAVVFATVMQACGGTQNPLPLTDNSATSRLDAPAHHGLSPLQRYELSPGTAEEHGNVVLTCPAGGPGCVLRVAADGSVEYETAGGLPSIALLTLTTEGFQDRLNELQRAASAVALVWRALRFPARDAAICLALIIGCEGGLGPIHYGSLHDLDATDFELVERGLGVSVAKRSDVSESTSETTYLALAGWLDHSFFMVETPDRAIRPADVTPRSPYYGAYSVGNVATASPQLTAGGAAAWSGAMVGLLLTDPDISHPDTLVTGAATVTVSHGQEIADLVVDVEFSNITDETTGANLGELRWSDLPLRAGSFGIDPAGVEEATVSRHPASSGISGRFYGPNHEEVGGLFGSREIMLDVAGDHAVRVEVSGAFGARRD